MNVIKSILANKKIKILLPLLLGIVCGLCVMSFQLEGWLRLALAGEGTEHPGGALTSLLLHFVIGASIGMILIYALITKIIGRLGIMQKIFLWPVVIFITIYGSMGLYSQLRAHILLKQGQKITTVPGKILTFSSGKNGFGSYITEKGVTRYLGSGKRRFCLEGTATIVLGTHKFGITDLQNTHIGHISFSETYEPFDFDISSDGQIVVFSSSKKSENSNLYILNMKDDTLIQITDGIDAYYPRLSPDGEKIVFEAPRYVEKPFPLTIYTISSQGMDRKSILEGKADGGIHPQWSPDGKKIVFVSSKQGEDYLSVYLYHMDHGQVVRITEGMDCRYPCFSPDGTMVAFTATKPGTLCFGANVFASKLEQPGKIIRLTANKQLDTFPHWATDEYIQWVE